MVSIGNNTASKLLICIFLISLLSSAGFAVVQDGPEWWNTDWSHKMIVDPNPPDSTIKNYPAELTVDTSKYINAGAMNSDCSDIRMIEETSPGSYTVLPHTISNCDSSSTTIGYIMGNPSNNHFLYFGNPSASSTAVATGQTMKTYMENELSTDWESSSSYSGWAGYDRRSSSRCDQGSYCAYLDGQSGRFDFGSNFGGPYSEGRGLRGDYRVEWHWEETTDSCNAHIGGYSTSSEGIHFQGSNNPQWYRWVDDSSIYGASVGGDDYYDPANYYGYQTYQRQDTDWSNKEIYSYTSYTSASKSNTDYWSGDYELAGFTMYNDCNSFWADSLGFTFQQTINSHETGVVNVFGRLRDDAGNPVTGVSVTPVEQGTTNDLTANSGELCANNGQTDSVGKFECAVDHSRVFDLDTPAGKIMKDIEFGQISESDWLNNSKHHLDDTAYFDYRMYEGDHSFYEDLTFSIVNQTNSYFVDEEMDIFQAGTDNIVFETTGNYPGSTVTAALDQREVYDMKVFTDFYQNHFMFRNVRVPDVIESGYNQNFIPESTMSNSLKFSAGQVLPAQTMITRPFSDFDVVNVSIQKTLDSSYSLVSDVMVRKFNIDFDAGWQDWSNRKTVSVQEVYNRDWDDAGSEMNDAWGVITFNPEGFQNNDCSDVRLTDKNNNVQDFTINTCQDDYVEMEFNSEMDKLEEKEFYVYYGNSGASDAQTAVQRPNEYTPVSFDTGSTGLEDTYFYNDNQGGFKSLNYSIPQNIEFIQRSMTVSGNRSDPRQNNIPVNLDTDYQDFSGVEIEPTRPYILEGVQIQLANTTVDTQFVVRNQSSGNNIIVEDVPNNDAGEYYINLTNQSVVREGDNEELLPGQRYLMYVRYGEARRASGTETQRPMFNLDDTLVHRQLFGLNPDGTSGSEGDYPTLVSRIDTVDPELPTNVTIVHENTDTTVYNGPDQLNDPETIDLSGVLDSVEWRRGDPLDDPKLHEFNITSDTDGELVIESDTQIEFEHPVTTVSKSASACSVNPESPSYFHVDRSDCSYLDRVNVSEGQWFRLDYRFRTPGPNDFDAPGDVNSYNVSDTIVRFDILQETEEFTTG